MTTLGAYSLVRFVEDVERGEARNVGVLISTEDRTLPKFVDRDDLGSLNEVVRRFAGLVEHLIEQQPSAEPESGHAFLAELAMRRFPHFEITEPRQIAFEGALENVLDDLARKLVDQPSGAHAWR